MEWKIRKILAVVCCLSAQHAIAEDSLGYFWDFGDGTVSHLAEPEHQYDRVGIYTVKREVYQNGTLVMNSEKVVDLVTPKIEGLDIVLSQLITVEEQTKLVAKLTSSEPLDSIRYQWYLNGQSLGDPKDDSALDYIFDDVGTHELTLNVLWQQILVKSLSVEVAVTSSDDDGSDGGDKDPGDGDKDPGGGDKDPDDGDGDGDTPSDSDNTDNTASHRGEQSSGGGSLGIVSLLGLLCFAFRRRK
ncbi:PKD domain-containing protein [Pseudoalteromonas luteoviolacea]|uniref:PKD domain-containing protein n=1 Tax=Pseudoalteromonas luteoviolacea TaxID=43657 RepID=UPI001F2EF9F8|nr:PKD domain-containing protein [Pseudoalteromonas luteoviolacea]MCF6441562.1 PKD domain-containing protein [Pseudoalteromonas luteoviolacea]